MSRENSGYRISGLVRAVCGRLRVAYYHRNFAGRVEHVFLNHPNYFSTFSGYRGVGWVVGVVDFFAKLRRRFGGCVWSDRRGNS